MDGRMIALKSDAVWCTISDFGYPFPPFAVSSHMRVRSIDRDVAMSIGLIDRDRRADIAHWPRPELHLDVDIPAKTLTKHCS